MYKLTSMFAAILLFVVIGHASALSLGEAAPVLSWLCERHAVAQGEGFPDGWCVDDSDVCQWPGVLCLNGESVASVELYGASVSSQLDARAYSPGVQRLSMRGCKIRGLVERTFDGVSVLDLSMNSLTGGLPLDFFAKLHFADLRHNTLASVGNLCKVADVPTLLLAYNNFSDDLTACVGSSMAKSLGIVDLSHNKFRGTAPFSGTCKMYSIEENQFEAIDSTQELQYRIIAPSLDVGNFTGRSFDREALFLRRCSVPPSSFADGVDPSVAVAFLARDPDAAKACRLQ